MSKSHAVIPIFVPHKGCPYDCIYCNQKKISGQIADMTVGLMRSIIDAHLLTLTDVSHVEIGFYGGSFTGIEREEQLGYLKTAKEYIKNGKINGIRLSTRPDFINAIVMQDLLAYNVNLIELGVQSMDNDVLKASSRGHGEDTVYRAVEMIKQHGIGLGIQTMIGLPLSNEESDYITGEKVVKMKPEVVRIYPTLVISGTPLEKLYNEGLYVPLSLDEAVSRSAQLLDQYTKNSIPVIRLGLMATDNINEGKDVVAGPFHPAMRQLVDSKILLFKMISLLEQRGINDAHKIVFATGSRNLSNAIGQKRKNVIAIKEKFSAVNVSVVVKENLSSEIEILDVLK